MHKILVELSTWLRNWDRYRTIIILLVVDTLQAEIQFLYFFYQQIWESRDAFLLYNLDTIKTSSKLGFHQYPAYDIIQYYFIGVGALISRMAINWLLFDGIMTGITSHIRAGIIGTVCTTVYITVAGILLWVLQYKYFKLAWYYPTLVILAIILYAAISCGVLYVLWLEQHFGSLQSYSKHLSASLLLICAIFVAFIQIQMVLWFVNVVWYNSLDPVFQPETHKFPM